MTTRLQRFRDAHRQVRLDLRTALSREVSALVRRGDAALGLRYFADPDPDLVSLPLYREPLLTVCAPTHRLARARRLTARMLAGEPWVAFPIRQGSSGESYAQVLAERLAAIGLGSAEIVPIDSLTAQKRLVEAGFGLGLVPKSSVEEELRLGHAARAAHRRHAPGGAGGPRASAPRSPQRRSACAARAADRQPALGQNDRLELPFAGRQP